MSNDLSQIDLDGGEDEKRPGVVLHAFRDRLKSLKQAKEYYTQGEIPKAVEKYTQYLAILATYYKSEEKSLSPKLFDQKKDLTEMLLISNVYWDLAKAYDRSPKLRAESIRCLQQFVKFTLGFKYQHANAQMLKKYVRSRKAHNKKAFQQALDKINVESKSCYIATHAYPNNEFEVLTTLRDFKFALMNFNLGKKFVSFYYDVSPSIVQLLRSSKVADVILGNLIFKPIIRTISAVWKILRNDNN
jgi:hypothetical protein